MTAHGHAVTQIYAQTRRRRRALIPFPLRLRVALALSHVGLRHPRTRPRTREYAHACTRMFMPMTDRPHGKPAAAADGRNDRNEEESPARLGAEETPSPQHPTHPGLSRQQRDYQEQCCIPFQRTQYWGRWAGPSPCRPRYLLLPGGEHKRTGNVRARFYRDSVNSKQVQRTTRLHYTGFTQLPYTLPTMKMAAASTLATA